MRILHFLLFVFAFSGAAFGQQGTSDVQVLQSVLAELQSVHAEIRMQSARAQTMQVLLFELQNQAGVMTRATQRADAARSKATDAQEAVRRVSAELARVEDSLSSAANDVDKERIQGQIDRTKTGLGLLRRTEQDRAADQQQAEAQLQKAQTANDSIQDELNAFMKTLQDAQPGGGR